MLKDVPLSFYPSSPRSLAWSADGELAVAAGDSVHILVPNRRRKKVTPGSRIVDPWIHVHILVNLFTLEEWPASTPATFNDFSIGEEIAENSVIGLAWSPTGLARHDRCALAVLTSNLLLSLWASASDPIESRSWSRVVVINNILAGIPQAPRATKVNLRLRNRVRAVAWTTLSSLDSARSQISHRSGLLVVLNDLSEICFVYTNAPNKPQTDSGPFVSRVLEVFRLGEVIQEGPNDKLEELSWIFDEGGQDQDAFLRCVHYGSQFDIAVGVSHFDDRIPKLKISKLRGPKRAGQSLRARGWNEIADQLDASSSSLLADRLQIRKRKFSEEHELGDSIAVKSYGTCAYQDYRAGCISLHPSELIQYITSTMESSFVLFANPSSAATGNRPYQLDFPWVLAQSSDLPLERQLPAWERLFSFLSQHSKQTNISQESAVNQDSMIPGEEQSKVPAEAHTPEEILSSNANGKVLFTLACCSIIWAANTEVGQDSLPWKIFERTYARDALGLGLSITFAEEEEAVKRVNEVIKERNENGMIAELEHCGICENVLFWLGQRFARCGQGHIQDRCSLTFLAIPQPGISKFCEVCQREYLHQDRLLRSMQPAAPDYGIAWNLLNLICTCIYCGAKFIG